MRSVRSKALATACATVALSIASAAELTDTTGIDAYLSAEIEGRRIPGAVALVVDDDGILYVSAHGRRDVAGETPMTEDTIFRIASMTKPVAATAIMMLVEEGRLSLDDEISDYVSDYADPEVIENFDATNGTFTTRPVSGDGGLFSTAGDYAKFIQLILNDGVTADGTRLLDSGSVAALGRNQLGDVRVSLQDEPNPALARAFPLGAGRDGFGLGFQVTGAHDEPGVRAPGSLSWAGIWNTEFWIDPDNGIGAVLLMQYLPFYDADAIDVLQGFEAAVYSRLR